MDRISHPLEIKTSDLPFYSYPLYPDGVEHIRDHTSCRLERLNLSWNPERDFLLSEILLDIDQTVMLVTQ